MICRNKYKQTLFNSSEAALNKFTFLITVHLIKNTVLCFPFEFKKPHDSSIEGTQEAE